MDWSEQSYVCLGEAEDPQRQGCGCSQSNWIIEIIRQKRGRKRKRKEKKRKREKKKKKREEIDLDQCLKFPSCVATLLEFPFLEE